MHAELQRYLDRMCNEISNKEARAKARLEIENHLLDELETLMNQGLSEAVALKRVLENATPPAKLGAKLNLAHRPFLLRYPLTVALSSLTALLIVALIGLSHIFVTEHFYPYLLSLHDNSYEKKFREDLVVLSQETNLPLDVSLEKNAHELIVKHLGSAEETPLARRFSEMRSLMNQWKQEFKVKESKSPWRNAQVLAKLKDHPQLTSLDLKWVDELRNYDHINSFTDPTNAKLFSEAKGKSGMKRIRALASYQIPAFHRLQDAILLRSLQLLLTNEEKKSRELLLHGFRLARSSRILVGEMVAASFLAYYENFRITFKTSWPKIPERTRIALRRTGWGWSSVLNRAMLKPDSFKDFESYLEPKYGMCSGLAEAQGFSAMTLDYFEDSAPFETDLSQIVASSRDLLRTLNQRCGFTELQALQELPVTEKDSFFENPMAMYTFDRTLPINPSRIPYLRRVVGMHLLTVAVPNYSAVYGRDEKEL